MNSTKTTSIKEINRKWFIFDCNDQILGRFSTKIASILTGKYKVNFSPNIDNGDYVILINAKNIKLSGKKIDDKKYYSHSKYPGGLKSYSARDMIERNLEKLIRQSIKGMMPKNKLSNKQITRLYVYPTEKYDNQAQQPIKLSLK